MSDTRNRHAEENGNRSPLGPVWFYEIPFSPGFPVYASIRRNYRNHHGGTDLPGPHIHTGIEIGVIHEGRGTIMAAGKRMVFCAGDICILDGSVPHVAFYATACVCTWIYFDPRQLFAPSGTRLDPKSSPENALAAVFPSLDYPRLDHLAGELIQEWVGKEPCYQDMIRSHLLELLALIERLRIAGDHHFTGHPSTLTTDGVDLNRLGPAIDFIHGHYGEKISNERLAQTVAMSVTNFRYLFRRLFGMPPHEYLTMYRLSMACAELKETERKIDAVAGDCGFEDISSFRRAFKKRLGVTPVEWRRRMTA